MRVYTLRTLSGAAALTHLARLAQLDGDASVQLAQHGFVLSRDTADVLLRQLRAWSVASPAYAKVVATDRLLSMLFLPTLLSVDLFGVTGVTGAALAQCSSLTSLNISHSSVSVDSVIEMLRRCPELRVLRMAACLNGDAAADLLYVLGDACRQLDALDVSENMNGIPAAILEGYFSSPGVHHLTTLNLCKTDVRDSGVLAILRHCPVLRALDVSYAEVSPAGFADAPVARQMYSLSVNHCLLLVDPFLSIIADTMPKLGELCCQRCRFSDQEIARYVERAGAHTSVLDLESCPRLHLLTAQAIADHAPTLTKIWLCDNRLLVDQPASLVNLAVHCTRLAHVNLRGLAGLTNEHVAQICHSLQSSLTALLLGGAMNVSDEIAPALCRCTRLERLDLSSTDVSDACLVAVLSCCPITGYLTLSDTRITDVTLTALAQHRPQLVGWLELANTAVTLQPLVGRMTHLRALNLEYCPASSLSLDHLLGFGRACSSLQQLVVTGCGCVESAYDLERILHAFQSIVVLEQSVTSSPVDMQGLARRNLEWNPRPPRPLDTYPTLA